MDVLPARRSRPTESLFVFWTGKIHRLDVATGTKRHPFSADVSLDLRPLWRVDTPVGGADLTVRAVAVAGRCRRTGGRCFRRARQIWICDIGADGKARSPAA